MLDQLERSTYLGCDEAEYAGMFQGYFHSASELCKLEIDVGAKLGFWWRLSGKGRQPLCILHAVTVASRPLCTRPERSPPDHVF